MKVPILTDQLSLPQPGGGRADYTHHNNIRPSESSDLPTVKRKVVTYETAITDMTHTILAKSMKILVCTLILNT